VGCRGFRPSGADAGGGDKVMGAICVTLPRERAESDKVDRLIDAMLHCANDVTKKMSGSSRSVPRD